MKPFINLVLIITGTLFLSNCDTSEPLSDTELLNETAEPLDSLEAGDKITYTHIESSSSPPPFADSLTFTNSIFAQQNEDSVQFVYAIDGETGFTLEAEYDAETLLEASLNATLSQDSPLGSRLRELLLREEAIFTEAEIAEIALLLNPAGANLAINIDDPAQLRSISNQRYLQKITSLFGDTLNGFMAGDYVVNNTGFEISFRDGVLDEFRFITPLHKIPFISSIPYFEDDAENGRFLFEFGINGTNN